MADDHEQQRARKNRHKGVGEQCQRKRLHQHQDANADQSGRGVLPRAAPENAAPVVQFFRRHRHLRTAPKVMPRSRCLRSRIVNSTIGIRKIVAPAATAGQSWPPSPMIMGMKGGAVCARPDVRSTAKAYSFQAKIRQKIAVAAMPVLAWGSTTLRKAWKRE